MSPVAQAILQSWSFPPYVTAINLITLVVYFRGWRALRAAMPERFTAWRLIWFVSGIAALEIALASPIDTFDTFLLTNHMLQHMILMMIVPPLILLGDPAIPLLHGLPLWASRGLLGPILSWSPLQRLGRRLTHPVACWLLMALATLGWHIPASYEFALRSPSWHEVEHACFLVTSLLFWWPVIQPWPSHPQWPRWTMPLYLLLADFVNSALSAFLAFSDRVLYPWYAAVPRLGGISAQSDQIAAGVNMWVIGSFAFLIPAVIITARLLSPSSPELRSERKSALPETRFARLVFFALMLALPLAAVAYGWLAPDTIDTDGAVIRLRGVSGLFRVTVFTEPRFVHAGPIDVSVLVQDHSSGETILDAGVDLAVQPVYGSKIQTVRATREQSTNRLLEAARVNLSSEGSWELRVLVSRGSDQGTFLTLLDVGPPPAQGSNSWLH
jgi:cytochrome c oxidase assembly factor CtaG